MNAASIPGVLVEAVLAAEEQLPEDVGKSGPLGLFLILVLLVAVGFLVRSMNRHIKRVPRSFDDAGEGPRVVVPDTPAELVDEPRRPGQDLLDDLRRAPRAIEGPRPEPRDDRTDPPAR
ncbi:hypothetical protein SAMN05660657_02436 [Geodermatophilus amargosae]|uniref:Uncharacterized protein n=1 Tax=Geodermatophilus amargosae TaxID=1296565 RepID=A0A1I7A2M8_9ACTN|nr:hypothetical protein [Geodermatophilus amargosae]SFT69173.1 hypothetical protein SAMN05660657_02436 [Geodermatophilus amargosae]